MGYMRHHAIVVSGWQEEVVRVAQAKAVELCGGLVSNIVEGVTNGYTSFFIGPDGSKEGWEDSDKGDQNRKRFIQWMRLAKDSFYLDWVEVQFADDNCETIVTAHSDEEEADSVSAGDGRGTE